MPVETPVDLPGLDDPVDLVLHIGTDKTGTSSIQALMNENRAALAAQGLLYPRSPGARRHLRFGLALKPVASLDQHVAFRRLAVQSPRRFRRRVLRRLVDEIATSGAPRVLLSDESLFGASVESVTRLRRFLDGTARSTRVVCYLRRQDDRLCSRYQQQVKVGEVHRLDDPAMLTDDRGIYDYRSRLGTWAEVVRPDVLAVRRYERDSFVAGDLVDDFLEAIGLDDPGDLVRPPADDNESLDAETVEFLRIVNLYRREHGESRPLPPDNIEIVARLRSVSTGPTLTLPGPVLDTFMDRFAEGNAAVARDLLGDPSGALFRAPRKTTGTTTEQRFDPGHLDRFLAAAQLPEQVHAPLRRLVEREAARR